MIAFLSRHRKPIFIATVTFFLLGIFVGLGAYLFTESDMSGVVAQVGGKKIPYMKFVSAHRRIAERLRDEGTEITDSLDAQIKQDIIRDFIVEEILCQQAEAIGLRVTDLEVASDIHQTFQRDGQFDPRLYFHAVMTQFRMPPDRYEDMRRRSILASKLRQLILQSVKVTPREVEESYREEHEGKLDGFEDEKNSVAQMLMRERALEVLNLFLRQVSGQLEIRNFLDQRERGR